MLGSKNVGILKVKKVVWTIILTIALGASAVVLPNHASAAGKMYIDPHPNSHPQHLWKPGHSGGHYFR